MRNNDGMKIGLQAIMATAAFPHRPPELFALSARYWKNSQNAPGLTIEGEGVASARHETAPFISARENFH